MSDAFESDDPVKGGVSSARLFIDYKEANALKLEDLACLPIRAVSGDEVWDTCFPTHDKTRWIQVSLPVSHCHWVFRNEELVIEINRHPLGPTSRNPVNVQKRLFLFFELCSCLFLYFCIPWVCTDQFNNFSARFCSRWSPANHFCHPK